MNPNGSLHSRLGPSRRVHRRLGRPPRDRGVVNLGLVTVPGQRFTMGTNDSASDPIDGESPAHVVTVTGFALAAHAVTNAQFEHFVQATGYRTTAELVGHSRVFQPMISPGSEVRCVVNSRPWWAYVVGANWRHPEGPSSDLSTRQDHPVTHMSWHDAAAFCAWAEARLPTEAEWEAGARGGVASAHFPWGNERDPGGEFRMNTFQGEFPVRNTALDGWEGTCPVDWFPPNHYGLSEMTGNVWEWVADWFSPTWYRYSPAVDPAGPESGTKRVLRGGSFLSDQNYGPHYRVDARIGLEPDDTACDIGFRVAGARGPGLHGTSALHGRLSAEDPSIVDAPWSPQAPVGMALVGR